jgi:hypothetical protein
MKKKKTGIVFLSNVLNIETYNFGIEIQEKLKLQVYFIIDSPNIPEVILNDKNFNYKQVIYIEDSICKNTGYINCMITGQEVNTVLAKTPIAYDKMLYYFCEQNIELDNLMIFEDDVFIPSVEVLSSFIKKYKAYDLVTSNNFLKTDNVLDWHWRNVIDKINPPYYYSMVGAFYISRNLLDCIKQYVEKNKTLFFTEVMFNTIAMQNNLKVKDAKELKSIVWQGKWDIDEFLLLPNNFFHPLKNLTSYGFYRKQIIEKRNSNYKPKNNNIPYWILEI